MTYRSIVHFEPYKIHLPKWGRCFWQDPNDGNLFLAYVTGNNALVFKSSADSGNSWGPAVDVAPVDDFSTHWNFDTFMDPRGHVHCLFRYNSSGCYQFLGKNGNTWTKTSGEDAPQGFVDVDATSPYARDICGSMVVMEGEQTESLGFPYTENPCPKVAIFLKASGTKVNIFTLHTPFKGTPSGLSFFPGFPSDYPDYTYDSNENGVGPFVGMAGTGTEPPGYLLTVLSAGSNQPGDGSLTREQFAQTSSLSSHIRAMPTQNAGWTSGIGYINFMLFTAPTKHPEVLMNIDIFAGATNQFGAHGYGIDAIRRRCEIIDELGHVTGVFQESSVNYRVQFTESVPRTGIFDLAESGSLVDISFNENRDFVFYMLKEDKWGREHIVRFLGRNREPPADYTRFLMSDIENYPSGYQYVVEPGSDIAGGNRGIPHIENFRCLKHCTQPTSGAPAKLERLVTVTTPPTADSGSALVVWDPTAAAALDRFKLPHYLIDYTRSSGTIFNGIAQTFKITNPHNLFDGATNSPWEIGGHTELDSLSTNTSSFAVVQSGSLLKLEFARPIKLERLDLTMNSTFPNGGDCGAIRVSGSIDDATYYDWGKIPSGVVNTTFMVKGLAADPATYPIAQRWQTPSNQSMFTFVKPCVAKYLILEWDYAFAPTSNFNSPTDIKIFGQGHTSFGRHVRPSTDSKTSSLFKYNGWLLRQSLPRTEKFRHEKGTLPPGFITRGDFRWGIAASGKYTTSHEIPGVARPDEYEGKVPSGIFSLFNAGNGYDDGFSVMVSTEEQNANTPNTSGVLEVDISVYPNYYDNTGASRSGDYISFMMRGDMHPNDILTFSTHYSTAGGDGDAGFPLGYPSAGEYAAATSPTGYIRYQRSGILQDWEPYRYYLAAGDWKLRWTYKRGPTTNPFCYGAVWIDNLHGVSGAPPGSIQGYVQTALAYDTGYINGFVESKHINAEIYGYASGSKDTAISNIYGYTDSSVMADVMSSIFGVVLGNYESSVLGFVYATSGVDETTYPTGYIKGFVSVPTGSGPSQIYGYVEGDWGTSILGYLRGFGDIGDAGVTNPEVSGDQRILGYVYGIDAASSILGVVGGSGGAPASNILGLVNAQHGDGAQVIYGFVSTTSGLTSTINAMTQGWEGSPDYFSVNQPMIYGFVAAKAPVSGNIFGYALAQLPTSNILGYLGSEGLVASGGGSVGGGPGAGSSSTSNVVDGTNWIWGIVKGETGEQIIKGYVHAPPGGTSEILGYVLSGADEGTVYAYSKGHDVAGTGIHGYLSGIYWLPTEINGYLFGVSGIEESRIYGVLTGDNGIDSTILGTLIGITSGINSVTACPSHNYQLQPVPSVTLPSNFYNPFA